jgi:membrane protein
MATKFRFLAVLRRAAWRSFEDDIFGIAKSVAYSAILTFFPALLVVASVMAASNLTEGFQEQMAYTLGQILPSGTSDAAVRYFQNPAQRSAGMLVSTSLLTLWTASGIILSWMQGFRFAYQLPKTWGIVKERIIAIALVLGSLLPLAFASSLVAFGDQIERWMIFNSLHALGPYILLFWTAVRWTIAALTSITVIAVIYHFAVPRTQPWHTVLPGATLATAIWFPATLGFGWYLNHVSRYNLIYGQLGVAIALLVWMYIVSLIVLFGAEVNALVYPRSLAVRQAEHERAQEKVGA